MFRPMVKRARKLRRDQTDHEAELWFYLRSKRLLNQKFYRQYAIGHYVVDFCCPKKSLVIELDGSWHLKEVLGEKDQVRDDYIESLGYRILRIWNNDWRENREAVLEKIAWFVSETDSPSP